MDSKRFNQYECFESEITIGRNATNRLPIDDKRLSGTHCKLEFNESEKQVYLHDLSTNGTYIFDTKVGKNGKKKLDSGDLVYVLHKSKVSSAEVLGFIVKFSFSSGPTAAEQKLNIEKQQQETDRIRAIQKEEETARFKELTDAHEEEKRKIQDQLNNFKTQDDKISEELECVICMDFIYSCVTLQPCLHNLCSACFYDWK